MGIVGDEVMYDIMEKNGDDGGGMGAPGTARRSFEQYVASFAAGEEPEWTKAGFEDFKDDGYV